MAITNDSNAEAPLLRDPRRGERDGQSDQDGPEDGEEGDVYDIQAIQDPKRGATGLAVRWRDHWCINKLVSVSLFFILRSVATCLSEE